MNTNFQSASEDLKPIPDSIQNLQGVTPPIDKKNKQSIKFFMTKPNLAKFSISKVSPQELIDSDQ